MGIILKNETEASLKETIDTVNLLAKSEITRTVSDVNTILEDKVPNILTSTETLLNVHVAQNLAYLEEVLATVRRVLPIAVIALCMIAIGSLVMTVAVFVTFFR